MNGSSSDHGYRQRTFDLLRRAAPVSRTRAGAELYGDCALRFANAATCRVLPIRLKHAEKRSKSSRASSKSTVVAERDDTATTWSLLADEHCGTRIESWVPVGRGPSGVPRTASSRRCYATRATSTSTSSPWAERPPHVREGRYQQPRTVCPGLAWSSRCVTAIVLHAAPHDCDEPDWSGLLVLDGVVSVYLSNPGVSRVGRSGGTAASAPSSPRASRTTTS